MEFVNGSYAINRHGPARVFTEYERHPSDMAGSQHKTGN